MSPSWSSRGSGLHRTDPPAIDRDNVPGVQLRSPAHFDLIVHPHLLGLDEFPRVGPVLGKAGQFQELTKPNRHLGNGQILNR
jgi:hypothetical protein